MPDITSLPPQAQSELLLCHADMLALIDAAMRHMAITHGTAAAYEMGERDVQVFGPMCPEGIVLICGADVYAGLQALQLRAKTIYAGAVASQALEKAKSA